jgi:hypothetical protein
MSTERWVKLGIVFAAVSALELPYEIAKDTYRHFKNTAHPGVGLGMHWISIIISLLPSVLLVLSMAMYKEKWPFSRKKIAEPTEPSQPSETLTLTSYPLTLVSLPKHTPASPGSTEHFRDKVAFVVRNSSDQNIEVWAPLWESTEVPAQAPLLTRLKKEGMETKVGPESEESCRALGVNREAHGWIGLTQPSSGDGLEVRLIRQNTGYLLFPMKVAGKMRYARLKI